jgi:hypothetical protein
MHPSKHAKQNTTPKRKRGRRKKKKKKKQSPPPPLRLINLNRPLQLLQAAPIAVRLRQRLVLAGQPSVMLMLRLVLLQTMMMMMLILLGGGSVLHAAVGRRGGVAGCDCRGGEGREPGTSKRPSQYAYLWDLGRYVCMGIGWWEGGEEKQKEKT